MESNELIRLSTWQGFDNCFTLAAQPIFDLTRSSEVFCSEVLLRYDAAPSIVELIQAYEKAGLSAVIDKWVAKKGIAWLAANPLKQCSINVSPYTLRDKAFADVLPKMASQAGVNPKRLKLELVERYLLAWSAEADSSLIKLKQEGFEIWLDDFGVGHSISDLVDRVRPQAIKMDGGFVRRLGKENFWSAVHHVLAIAKEFDCKTIAEGVDCEDTLRRVKELDFDMAQGYYLAPPEPLP